MRLNTYHGLFSELARRHKSIAATPENGRFQRILLSADPVQKQFDLSAFYGALRNMQAPLGQPFLVVENYQVDYHDNQGDYLSREFQGAFLVLQLTDLGDPDTRDVAFAHCETIGEQVLAAAVELLRDEHQAVLTVEGAWAEHIGPIADGHVGVRLNFSWREPATPDLTYDPDHFSD